MVATTNLNRPLEVAAVRDGLGLSRERMARLVDASSKSIERWEKSASLPQSIHVRKQLGKLQEIVHLGLLVYTPEGFELFLTTPLPVFNGRTALQMMELGDAEMELVVGALAADYEGLGF